MKLFDNIVNLAIRAEIVYTRITLILATRICLQFLIVVIPDHTRLLLLYDTDMVEMFNTIKQTHIF